VTGTDDFSTTSSTALSCGDEKEFQLPAFFFGRPMAPVIQAFQSFFPPGGVVSSGMDRLVRIGILRI
jgi:hypothetical protein